MTTSSGFTSYLRIIARRWWLFVLLPLVTVAAILVVGNRVDTEYLASERLQIGVLDTQEVPLYGQARADTAETATGAVHEDFYGVLRLDSVAWRTIADLGLDMSAAELIGQLDSQHQKDVIVVTMRMPTPELAQQVLTRHVDNAIAAYRGMRTMPAQTTRTFLEAQLAEQEKQLAAAEKALQDFQLQNEVSDLQREIFAQQDLKRDLSGDRDRAAAEAARNDRLQVEVAAAAAENNAQADALQASLVVTDTKKTPTPIPDVLARTQAQILSLRGLADKQQADAQNYKAIAAGQRAAMDEIDRQLAAHEQQIVYLLGLQDQYRSLVDQEERAQASYGFLSDKADEARLKATQGADIGYLQVIEPAPLPQAPLPKRTTQYLLVGLIVSILLALILAFTLAFLENSLGRQGSAGRVPAPRRS